MPKENIGRRCNISNIGLHTGQVIDNIDPNGEGKIKVLSSTLFGSGVLSNWIDYVSPPGYTSIPNIGDKVAIFAENNDPRYCHCIGLSYANSKKDGQAQSYPSNFNPLIPGQQISMTSALGQYMLIDDATLTITIKADDVIVDGNLTVDGDLTVTGDVDITGDATIGGISFLNHLHTYTTPQHPAGPGNTSAPNP